MDRIAGVHLNSLILKGIIIIGSPQLRFPFLVSIPHSQSRVHFSLEEVGGKVLEGR